MMDEGRGERLYFHGPVFIETEPYLSVDLNTGSCVEETAMAPAPESKNLHEAQNPLFLFLLLLLLLIPSGQTFSMPGKGCSVSMLDA